MEETALEITPAEWQVMRIVWTLGETTSSQLTTILQRKVDWKAATVKTLLRRLVAKGALATTKQGRGFIYHPLVAEQSTMDEVADGLFSSICERRVGTTLEHVINHATLSKADVAKLQEALKNKAATAPDEVECNCVPGMKMKC
ncbi:CopY/TcrY family copper transport repressor [Limosilactobacillus sp.]|jgi:CopY/TcrY family copper transport repressor|uniref:CopY/TcrY family copper transport repressor n=1 Tax=Limosilactobacillus sp. TaxID=2773925 RepID=UPI0025BDEFC8|nr:CopY/TcrY family copper transport repressor [Limosilactobacillus sp.]MCH3922768.1 CopY/TcrY family copper transport repressor [Limosilactobacillus sp.]MCH3927451.1 CopY/TcrY family copper transport repressor [Limosilactobacillus sp.]